MLDEQKAVAQQVADELYNENLIPLKLFPGWVEPIGAGEYVIRFYDSRLHSVDVTWHENDCFEEVFRAGLLKRVHIINDPFEQEHWPMKVDD